MQARPHIADRFENVSILFADIVEFTPAAALMTPSQLVDRLNRVFSEFDVLALRLGVEKIKTIGDAYMAATGCRNRGPTTRTRSRSSGSPC